MNTDLIKRIITSIILLCISFFFIFNGTVLFSIFLIFIFYKSVQEWRKLSMNNIVFINGIIFLIFSFISAFILKENDILFFLLAILITVSSDIGGFIFGKVFKGPKLTKISPNKTYSGVLGSYIFSLITGLFYIYFFKQSFFLKNELNYLNVIIIIFIISFISQIGDLIVSYFKRLSKLKDTGNILPGHGGLLDRIDGIIFTMPSSYIIYKFFL